MRTLRARHGIGVGRARRASRALRARDGARGALLLLASCGALAACTGQEVPEPPSPGIPPVRPQVPVGPPARPTLFDIRVTGPGVSIRPGGVTRLSVYVLRFGRPAAPVRVGVTGLPQGVYDSLPEDEVVLADGEAVFEIELRADASAAHSLPTSAQVTATAAGERIDMNVNVTVAGGPGDVDTSFEGGVVRTSFANSDGEANGVAVLPDAKVLVVGTVSSPHASRVALARYDRDGKLDSSFGERGVVLTSQGSSADGRAVALQRDGKVIVAGSAHGGASGVDFFVARYLSDGTLDPSFGSHGDGKVVTAIGDFADRAHAVVVQPDGKIVVGGDTFVEGSGLDFALARYLPDGSLDPSFGAGGVVVLPVQEGTGRDVVHGLALHDVAGSRGIVAVGDTGDFAVARFDGSGVLDPTFGTEGLARGLFGARRGAAYAVKVSSQGALLVAGHAAQSFAVAKLDAGGRLVSSFGDGGTTVTALSAQYADMANAIVEQQDGKIILGGFRDRLTHASGDFAFVRYLANGAVDPSFGKGGVVIFPTFGGQRHDAIRAMGIQEDERVPTARLVSVGASAQVKGAFSLMRHWL